MFAPMWISFCEKKFKILKNYHKLTDCSIFKGSVSKKIPISISNHKSSSNNSCMINRAHRLWKKITVMLI